jgi:uncharacterized membrane protein
LPTALEYRTVWIVFALLAGTGCKQKVAEALPPAPDEAQGSTANVETATSVPVTESSLSLRRGMVTLTEDSRTLRFCGDTVDVWLVDQGDPTLDDVYAKLAGEPGTPLYVEVRGERIDSPAGTAIPATFKQAFLLEELLYAGVPAEGGGCGKIVPPNRLQARGNEPFWAIEVGEDKMLMRQLDQPAPLEFGVEETLGAEGTVTYRGASAGHQLTLTITSGSCSDSMSGDYFAYTAETRLDGRTLNGCARLGE